MFLAQSRPKFAALDRSDAISMGVYTPTIFWKLLSYFSSSAIGTFRLFFSPPTIDHFYVFLYSNIMFCFEIFICFNILLNFIDDLRNLTQHFIWKSGNNIPKKSPRHLCQKATKKISVMSHNYIQPLGLRLSSRL
jgi:hypothetical protein